MIKPRHSATWGKLHLPKIQLSHRDASESIVLLEVSLAAWWDPPPKKKRGKKKGGQNPKRFGHIIFLVHILNNNLSTSISEVLLRSFPDGSQVKHFGWGLLLPEIRCFSASLFAHYHPKKERHNRCLRCPIVTGMVKHLLSYHHSNHWPILIPLRSNHLGWWDCMLINAVMS